LFYNPDKKWILLSLGCLIANGIMAIDQKYQDMSIHGEDITGYLTVGFSVEAIIAFAMFLLRKAGKGENTGFDSKGYVGIGVLLCGVSKAALFAVVTLAVQLIPVTLVLVVNNGVSLILVSVLDMLAFKQNITQKQMIGIMMGIAAVLILSL